MNLSIIIIAYNESLVIKRCLDSIINALSNYGGYEILVVNNNSNDDTGILIDQVIKQNSHLDISHLNECNQGTSNARNKGLCHSTKDWVLFLDGDVFLEKDFFKYVDSDMKEGYDLIGGVYDMWSDAVVPKWYPVDRYTYSYNEISELRPIEEYHIAGSVMLFNKEKLISIKGFPSDKGPLGDQKFYGEDTYVEQVFKRLNFSVGIDPRLLVHHYVPEEKMKLSFILMDHYKKGRDSDSRTSIYKLVLSFIKNMSMAFYELVLFLIFFKEEVQLKIIVERISIIFFRIGNFARK